MTFVDNQVHRKNTMNESLAETQERHYCLDDRIGCRGVPSRTGNQKVVDKQPSEKHLSVGSSLCIQCILLQAFSLLMLL